MFQRFIRRGLQLVALLTAGLLVALLVGFYVDSRDNPMMPSGRWIGWIGYTVLIAVFVSRDHRQHWSRVSFWIALAGLFALHTVLYRVAFQAIAQWRGIWFLPISIVEYALILLVLQWLGYRNDAGAQSARVRRRS